MEIVIDIYLKILEIVFKPDYRFRIIYFLKKIILLLKS